MGLKNRMKVDGRKNIVGQNKERDTPLMPALALDSGKGQSLLRLDVESYREKWHDSQH
jgi:hypothetical protein